jgi:rhodanese-related sulfurtransferase
MITIDLRTEAEQRQNPVPSDITIEVPPPPLSSDQIAWMADTLMYVASRIPGDEIIKVFCSRGYRSGLAAAILKQAGYTVVDAGGALHDEA